jgi:hypothetical protein
MKRIISLVIIMILFFVCACQPTPSGTNVNEKSYDTLIKKAEQNEVNSDPTDLMQLSNEKYKESFEDNSGKLKINIDADVYTPESESWFITRVSKDTFTNDKVRTVLGSLLHNVLYSCEFEYSTRQSKQDIMESIIKEQGNNSSKYQNDSISYLQDELNNAPETLPRTEFAYSSPLSNSTASYGYAEDDNGLYETVCVYSDVIRYVASSEMTLSPGAYVSMEEAELIEKHSELATETKLSSREIKALPELSISEAEALSLANQKLAEMGITGLSCNKIEKKYGGNLKYDGAIPEFVSKQAVWEIRYGTENAGKVFTYTTEDCFLSENDFSIPWSYERLVIRITDQGIIMFEWAAPHKIEDTIVQNATLLPFDEVMSIFRTMILAKNLWFDGDYAEIDISKIQLGMGRITEPNSRDKGLLIPVWDFFGTMTSNGSELSLMEKAFDRSFLTINAIDGTVIDRSLGY